MRAYPDDPLEDILRNVFDFDVYKPEAMEFLLDVLNHHGYVFLSFTVILISYIHVYLFTCLPVYQISNYPFHTHLSIYPPT